MKVLLVSSDPDFRAPVAAMLGVRGVEVRVADDVFDAIALARSGEDRLLIVLHGVDAHDAEAAQRGAARTPARTLVAVVGAEAPDGARSVAFDGRFPPLVDALVALAPPDAAPEPAPLPGPAALPAREPEPNELLALARFGTYHQVLGISAGASEAAVREAADLRMAWVAAKVRTSAEPDLIDEIAGSVADAALVLGDPALRAIYEAGLGAATGR